MPGGEGFLNLTNAGAPHTHPSVRRRRIPLPLIDPHLTMPTFLSGRQFQPRTTPMVHHTIVLIHRSDNPTHREEATLKTWNEVGLFGKYRKPRLLVGVDRRGSQTMGEP